MAIDWNGPEGRALSGRLANDDLVWLTTVASSGTPHPSLVWFWWDGSGDTPRVANIAARPLVALNFNSHRDGGGVGVISGTARIDRSLPTPDRHDAYVAKYRSAIEDGLGMDLVEFGRTYPVPILVAPISGRA